MLHNLENSPGARKNKKRLGRGPGSTDGKTSGRGHKGYLSRSGSKKRIGFEGGQMPLHIRLPKRGFSNAIFKKVYSTVNLGEIETCAKLDKTQPINLGALQAAGLVSRRNQLLKILGDGELTSKINIQADAFSATAKEKIEKVGGQAEFNTQAG